MLARAMAVLSVVGATALPAQSARRPAAAAVQPRTATTAKALRDSADPRATPTPRRRTVVVDAGHGGPDRGMTGITSTNRRVYEKDIALAVATKVAARLEGAGVHVVMTRTRDTLIALDDRGRIANRSEGDLFISVHVNAANPRWKQATAARGFETYFLAEARTEDERRVAQMENEVVRFETEADVPRDNDLLGFMLNDMAQNEHLRESSELATTIQGHLRGAHPGPSRGVKQAGFRVLVTAFMPAVLVEIGFGTNRAEADWLASSSGQARLADAISTAALEYLARYERRVSGGTGRTAGGSK